jgi:serine/threonine protein kinase HipA of HipAB toxin-antitoxin module
MHTFGDRRVLIVERFDRLWTEDQRLLRLPQEDSCQALSVHPNLKYEGDGGPGITDILKLLRGSVGQNKVGEIVRRAEALDFGGCDARPSMNPPHVH